MPTYRVWYMRPEWFANGIIGRRPPSAALEATHVYLKDVEAASMEQVYSLMQGEVWSPNGEAMPLIRSKGLAHTSMSVGDVIETDEGTWLCASFGFDKLLRGS
jgi:hypothetical protein